MFRTTARTPEARGQEANGAEPSSERPQRRKTDGLAATRVGVFFAISTLILGTAATNTGNNGLFLVVAVMVSILIVGAWLSSVNLRGLSLELDEVGEAFANSPGHFRFTVGHGGRFLPRWLLLFTIDSDDVEPPARPRRRRPRPFLVPILAPGEQSRGHLEVMMRRRGLRRIRAVRVLSLFPLGLFRQGRRLETDLEILVYPEIFGAAWSRPSEIAKSGDTSDRRAGWGHELYALRDYRPGDDPRHLHWKQSARLDRLIYQQRESEASRRLAIIFDNAVGPLDDEADRRQFERLVSEAATAALDYLEEGFEVSLVTRDTALPFASGPRQRRNILETLALVDALPAESTPLVPRSGAGQSLELSMGSSARPVGSGVGHGLGEVA